MSIAVQVAIVMVILLVVMLAAGIPIGVGIGLSSAVSMICMLPGNVAFATSAQRIFAGSNSFSLIAIPFFILAGNIMNNGGIALRLVNCAKVLGGKMPGSWHRPTLSQTCSLALSAVLALLLRRLSEVPWASGGKRRLRQKLFRCCQCCLRSCRNAHSPKQYHDRILYGSRQCFHCCPVHGRLYSWYHLGCRRHYLSNYCSKTIRIPQLQRADP